VFDTVAGLPLHPLVVHATVVVVPVAALAVLLAAASPRFRRWAGLGPPALSLLALVLVPVSTRSGEALQRRIGGGGELVTRHAELGDGLLPWVVALALVAALVAVRERRAVAAADGGGGPRDDDARPAGARSPLGVALAVAALLVAGGTIVQTVLAGHSGATAVWSGVGGLPAPTDEG
jgi:hypothetical protein